MAFWKSFLDSTFRLAISNSFASCNNFDNVLIYFSCNPWLGYKETVFLNYFISVTRNAYLYRLKTSFFIIGITQHITMLTFCISVFTLLDIYLRMIIFTLFVYRINLQHCCCIAIHVVWKILTMKIRLNMPFPRFQLIMDVFVFSF